MKLVRSLLIGYVLIMLIGIVWGGIYNLQTKRATPQTVQDKPPYAATPLPKR